MAWEKVMRPLELGGLGIINLETMGWALQMRWLWIEKTKPDRPWAGLEIPVHPHSSAMFAISVVTTIWQWRRHSFLVRPLVTWSQLTRTGS